MLVQINAEKYQYYSATCSMTVCVVYLQAFCIQRRNAGGHSPQALALMTLGHTCQRMKVVRYSSVHPSVLSRMRSCSCMCAGRPLRARLRRHAVGALLHSEKPDSDGSDELQTPLLEPRHPDNGMKQCCCCQLYICGLVH